METLITVIHVVVAVFMILVVLIQGGNQGGMSAAFGGGNSQGFFGATGATTVLGKLTYGAAAIFMVTSIWLTVLKGNSGNIGLSEKLKAAASQETQQAPANQQEPAKTEAAPQGTAGATDATSNSGQAPVGEANKAEQNNTQSETPAK